MSPLNLKLGQNKIKLTSSNCDLSFCCLTIIKLSVGRDIMGYGPDPLPSCIELSKRSHTIKFKLHFTPCCSYLHPTSWSHHLIMQLDHVICSAPVHISYIFHQATCSMMVACFTWMYSLIGQIPAASSASAIRGYSHSPSYVCWYVIPGILRIARL